MKQPAAFLSAQNVSCIPTRSSGGRNVAARTAQVVSQQEVMPDPEARNVAIFVEPSPFSHISGMKNRFESLIKNLTDQGDDVMVFTPDRAPPKEYFGAKVRSSVYALRVLLMSCVHHCCAGVLVWWLCRACIFSQQY